LKVKSFGRDLLSSALSSLSFANLQRGYSQNLSEDNENNQNLVFQEFQGFFI
jgi:hypothetical protein